MVSQDQRTFLRAIQVVGIVTIVTVLLATFYVQSRIDRFASHLDALNKELTEENARIELRLKAARKQLEDAEAAKAAASSATSVNPKVTP
jgi:hypothetical protein